MSNIIKDSSIWVNPEHFSAIGKNNTVMCGIVRDFKYTKDNEPLYIVEAITDGYKMPLYCRLLNRLGGAYNYDDMTLRKYTVNGDMESSTAFDIKQGDNVLVACINGNKVSGIILGCLSHLSRKNFLDPKDGPQHKTEFNGIETFINKDGEYTMTFKGQPINISLLSSATKSKIPSPIYDTIIGTSFLKFDKTGGIKLSDNSTTGIQSIYIDKNNNNINILSGNIQLKLDKTIEEITIKNKLFTISTQDLFKLSTKNTHILSTQTTIIKTPKIAIGTGRIELLDKIISAIDKIGKVKIIHPMGVAFPIEESPEWAEVAKIKNDIDSIRGSLN